MTSAASIARSARTPALVAAVLGGAVGCGFLALWCYGHEHASLITAMAIVAVMPIVVRVVQGKWDPFEPINLMVIGVLVLFVWRPIVELTTNIDPWPGFDVRAGFNEAMVIGIVGTSALYIGYFWRAGERVARRFEPLPDHWDAERSVRFARRLLLIGAFLTLIYIGQVGVHAVVSAYTGRSAAQNNLTSASSGYFYQGPYLAIPAAFILLIAFYQRRTLGTGILLAFSIILSLAITIPPGDRTFILELTLPLVVLWYLRRRRRPRAISLVVTFLVFLMFVNIELVFRSTVNRNGKSVPAAVANAITHPGHELTKFINGPDPAEFSVLEIEAHYYDQHLLQYQPGSTIRSIAIGWIPHQFFGGKKPFTPLQYVTWTTFPATRGGGSYGPSMFGSMFADYGWPSLVLLSLFVGFGLRAIWEYFKRGWHRGGMQLVYAGFLPLVIILLRDDIDDIFYRSVFLVVPLLLCVRTCARPPVQVRAWLARHGLSVQDETSQGVGAGV